MKDTLLRNHCHLRITTSTPTTYQSMTSNTSQCKAYENSLKQRREATEPAVGPERGGSVCADTAVHSMSASTDYNTGAKYTG